MHARFIESPDAAVHAAASARREAQRERRRNRREAKRAYKIKRAGDYKKERTP